MDAIGKGLTDTTVADDVAEQLPALATATLYEPPEFTVIDCDVAPLLHKYDNPELAIKVTEPPIQKVVAPDAVIVTVGNVLTVTIVADDVAEQLLALATVTVYEPPAVIVVDCVVAPLLHKYDVPVLAVNITEPPAQKVVALPAVMVAVGNEFTVTTVAAEVAEQPLELFAVTV